jgi:ABC-2 type transport system ATP-binding protein
MHTVEVNNIHKSYGDKAAVKDLSFTVEQGEIFGIIGPNGAGKTTTIRMLMDIIKPDSGEVKILGEKMSEAAKDKIGYLPEERGLYKKMRVIDSILYFASLKGKDKDAAEKRARELLTKMGMLPNQRKKTEELSRGMSQIIQFIVTITHDPQLIILDEPFSGLDPVNTELMKNMFLELKEQGKAVMLSTHQMNQVEELCDRVLMINNGQAVLYGDLAEVKSKYQSNSILLEYKGELGEIPGVAGQNMRKGYAELVLDGTTSPQQILENLISHGVTVTRFEIATPPLNDIFIKIVGKGDE